MQIIVGYGNYVCTSCGQWLTIERAAVHASHMIASCQLGQGCSRHGVRLRIPILRMACEVMPPEEKP